MSAMVKARILSKQKGPLETNEILTHFTIPMTNLTPIPAHRMEKFETFSIRKK